MWKKALASIFLLGLIIYGVYSFTNEQVEREPDTKGAGMVALDAPTGIKVGELAPDFTLETLDGKKVSLSDLKGKKVFLNFWATWCGPCEEEMPEMQRFQEEFGDEVVVLAVNSTASEKNVQVVRDYIQEGGYTFPVVLDRELEVTNEFQVISIPTTYFIGTDGVVQLERKVGPMTYEFMIEMKNKLN